MLFGIWFIFYFGRFLFMCWIGERKMVGIIFFGCFGLLVNVIVFFFVLFYWYLIGLFGIVELIFYVVN